jgi:hypothetical protein
MIPLPQKTRKNGYNYVLIHRGTKYVIYSQWYGKAVIGYEVMLIRTKPARFIKGFFLQAREAFASNEDFGRSAWSFKTLEKAMQWFLTHEKGS